MDKQNDKQGQRKDFKTNNKYLPEELPLPQQTFLPTQEPVNKQKALLPRTEEFIIYMNTLFFIESNIFIV